MEKPEENIEDVFGGGDYVRKQIKEEKERGIKEAQDEMKKYYRELDTKEGQASFREEAKSEKEFEEAWGKAHKNKTGEFSEKEKSKAPTQEDLDKKREEGIKYWAERGFFENDKDFDKFQSAKEKEERDNFISARPAEIKRDWDDELKSRIERAITADGRKSNELAYDITRNFYLEKLGYSVKYVGFLHGKGRILNEKGEYVLDEKTGKPMEFNATFRHKEETPILKFLKEELEKKSRGSAEKEWEKKHGNPEIRKESGEPTGEDGSSGEKPLESSEKEKLKKSEKIERIFNIKKISIDCLSKEGFFNKENLKKLTMENNVKDIAEAMKSYGKEVKWPSDFESIIKKYDGDKSERDRFNKVKEEKGNESVLKWILGLLFKLNVPVL